MTIRSAIRVPPMTDLNNRYLPCSVVDFVNHPIVSLPYPKEPVATREFFGARRAWIGGQCLKARDDAGAIRFCRKLLDLPAGRWLQKEFIFFHFV